MPATNFKYYLGAALGLIIIAYALYQTHGLISGPQLTVAFPPPASTVHSPLLIISGEAKRITSIALDDRPIFTDTAGRFREKLLLAPGYTIITLTVRDQFNRRVERRLGVVYEP